MSILYDSNVVVTLSFLIFVGIVLYAGVHRTIAAALDARAAKIRAELDEARALREAAQRALAEVEQRTRDIAAETAQIVAHAKLDAEAFGAQAKADIAANVARRLKSADEQIAMAESAAIRAVRDRAIDVAVEAAREVMATRLGGDQANALTDRAIAEVGAKLH